MKCPQCGAEAKTQTRRQHAEEVARGVARDDTQRAMNAAKISHSIELTETTTHPTDKDPLTGKLRVVKGNADDTRDVCDKCGNYSNWRN